MLVLKRKEGQSLIIDDNIEITIIESENGFVKLSINAPKRIKIVRKELIEEIKNVNQESIQNIDLIIKNK